MRRCCEPMWHYLECLRACAEVLALQLVLPNRSSLRFFGNLATVLVAVMHLVLSALKFMAYNYLLVRGLFSRNFLRAKDRTLKPSNSAGLQHSFHKNYNTTIVIVHAPSSTMLTKYDTSVSCII